MEGITVKIRSKCRIAALSAASLTSIGLVVAGSTVALSPAEASTASGLGGASGTSGAPVLRVGGCEDPLFKKPVRAAKAAARTPSKFRNAAARSGDSTSELKERTTGDRAAWLDTCGNQFYVEPTVDKVVGEPSPYRSAAAAAPTPVAPLSDTFVLESKPGAALTVYLDFDGATVANTAWNADFNGNQPIDAEPFSVDADVNANFSSDELAHIQTVWNVVAEDYAPFDVNVTTKDPGAAAIERTGPADANYGLRVVVTNGGPIFNSCRCGGVAYLDTFKVTDASARAYYSTAWVFGFGTQSTGKYMGDAAAHEVGHTLGLVHDGQGQSAYFGGSGAWGPVMGAPYTSPITQWSKGEYSGATATQDDLAIISSQLPYRTDEAGASTASAAALPVGTRTKGYITSAADQDVYSFQASGPTTVKVETASGADLDASLTILDAAGATLATINPAAAKVTDFFADGLDATWTADLGPSTATYYAAIDGVGTGDPRTAGLFSDYGSIGAYWIKAGASQGETPPLVATKSADVTGTAGSAITPTSPVTVAGGTQPYEWGASGLPDGLTIDPATGVISGTATDPGTYAGTVDVMDADGKIAAAGFGVAIATSVPGGVVINDTSARAFRTRTSSIRLKASGGGSKRTWSASGLPTWASISPTAGTIKIAPTENGVFTFEVSVTSVHKDGVTTSSDSATVTLTVIEPQVKFSIDRVVMRGGAVGQPYVGSISIKGGYPAYAWTYGGYLPFGTTLTQVSPFRVEVTGTPTTAGQFGFYVVVSDGTGTQIVRNIRVTIKSAA